MNKVIHLVMLTIVSMQLSCTWLGLDKVLQDERTVYKKSESLPPLELPPDLISDTIDQNMLRIPGEQQDVALSTYTKKEQLLTPSKKTEDRRWLVAQGTRAVIWSQLRIFWQKKGYQLELNDIALGIMETKWRNYTVNGDQYRDKTTVFIEEEVAGKQLHLFVSSIIEIRQQEGWRASAGEIQLAEKIATEIDTYLSIVTDQTPTATATEK